MSGRMKTVCGAVVFLLAAGMPLRTTHAQPDTVVLDDMSQYYESVEFGHAMHVELLGDNSCATCHHHTVGTDLQDENCKRCHANSRETDSAACSDCHSTKPFSADYLEGVANNSNLYHKDKPGLKGAFHQLCLGCHEEMGAPADCEACHARTDDGDRFFHAGKYAPPPAKASKGHK